jgi:hypothetical protein
MADCRRLVTGEIYRLFDHNALDVREQIRPSGSSHEHLYRMRRRAVSSSDGQTN